VKVKKAEVLKSPGHRKRSFQPRNRVKREGGDLTKRDTGWTFLRRGEVKYKRKETKSKGKLSIERSTTRKGEEKNRGKRPDSSVQEGGRI